jgi:hypothetical protein
VTTIVHVKPIFYDLGTVHRYQLSHYTWEQVYDPLGMEIRIWVPDTRRIPDPTGTSTGTIFYPRVAPVPDPIRDGYGTGHFFPPAGNPTGTRYFTTAIILGCEQVKMCSFCYINYDLF